MVLKLPPTSATLVNYDFTDMLNRRGYVTFYGVVSPDFKKLSRAAIASQTPKDEATAATTDYTTLFDLDFDFDISVAQIVAGADLFVSATIETVGATNTAKYARMKVYVYRVDTGAGENLIGSTTAPTPVEIAANVDKSARMVTKVTLTETKFVPGEKIRVNTLIEGKMGNSVQGTFKIWYDGASRGNSTQNQVDPDATSSDLGYKNSTNLIVEVPFRIRT